MYMKNHYKIKHIIYLSIGIKIQTSRGKLNSNVDRQVGKQVDRKTKIYFKICKHAVFK